MPRPRQKGQQGSPRDAVLERVFQQHFVEGADEIPFSKRDIEEAIIEVAKLYPGYEERNVPDLRYQFTANRRPLPQAISNRGHWIIAGRGKGKYAFLKLKADPKVAIQADLQTIFLPNATPEIVQAYAGDDEQGLLAKLHYNRLLDTFLQITCYRLQNHWRTTVTGAGQCEIDDLYVGVNYSGKQFVVPIEAKCCNERLSKTQIVNSILFAQERYPQLITRPVGVQEVEDGSIVLIEFVPATNPDDVKIRDMRRYSLVSRTDVPLEIQQQLD